MLKLKSIFLFCFRYEWGAMLVGGWGRVGALLALLLPASYQEEHPGPAPCQEEHPGHAPTDLLPHHLDGADASREPRIDSEFFPISVLCKHFYAHFRVPPDRPDTDQVSTFIWQNHVTLLGKYNLQLLFPIGGKRYTWKQSSHLMSLHVLCMWTFYCCWMARQVTWRQ